MQQAYNYFNAGKYKEAFNQLNSNSLNIQSYQPNLAICEYLLSRTNNSLQVCLRKLANLLAKKNKKDNDHHERLTEQLIKYNIGILMHLSGKKENAYLLFRDIYQNQKCLMEFLKYRLLLLLMELNLSLKNGVEAFNLSLKYLFNRFEQKNVSSSWISLLFHEHFRAHFILKQELGFMFAIFFSQSLIQIGVTDLQLPPDEERINFKEILLQKAKKRKNAINKYYEINLHMTDRFFQAQKQFHLGNKEKALELMNFNNIQSQYEQMPQTKIITNIYSGLTYNNTAIIYMSINKHHLALHYFDKASKLLSKGCTGVQDKDLQLFSVNFSNHIHRISYNSGLLTLMNRPAEAYNILDFFKRNNYLASDFKYWYRIGQAQIEYYHENYTKIPKENRTIILQSALNSFTNCIYVLTKKKEPNFQKSKELAIFKQDSQIDYILIKMKGQTTAFRQSSLLLVCYISLLLEKYYKVIFYAKQLLESNKTSQSNKIQVLQYLIQSYTKLNRTNEAEKYRKQSQKLIKQHKRLIMHTGYFKNNEIIKQKMDAQHMEVHQNAVLKIKYNHINQAYNMLKSERFKYMNKTSMSRRILQNFIKKKM